VIFFLIHSKQRENAPYRHEIQRNRLNRVAIALVPKIIFPVKKNTTPPLLDFIFVGWVKRSADPPKIREKSDWWVGAALDPPYAETREDS
jgi:hypothetical protein